MALRYNLHINQGETWELTIPLVSDDPDADFSGHTAAGQIRADPASTSALYEWSPANNNLSVEPLAVVISVPAAVSTLWAFRRGVWDVELVAPDGVATTRLAAGWVFVTPDVTRALGETPEPATVGGYTLRGASDYDDTVAPAAGQAIVWNGTTYAPDDVTGGAGGSGGAVDSVNGRTGNVTGLAEASDLTAHTAATAGVHGIADTSALATTSSISSAISTHTAAVDPHGDRAYADTQVAGRQPLDSDLTTIAGLTATTDSILQAKASAWTTRTPAQLKTDLALTKSDVGLSNVTNNAQVTGVTAGDATITIGGTSTAPTVAVTGSTFQPLDSDLTTIAGLTATTDSFLQAKSGTWAARTIAQVSADLGLSVITGNNQTGTTYTFALSDAGKVVEGNNASAITFTIPPNSSVAFPVGTVIEVFQQGAGQVTIAAGAGVTLRAPSGAKLAAQYASASLRQRATDEWVLAGNVTT